MSRDQPASDAWAIYYAAHPEVLASWGEANGREPTCRCRACLAGRGEVECTGSGQRWDTGTARCPGCGRRALVMVGREPGRARIDGGFLGHVPTHTVPAPAGTSASSGVPLRLEWRGTENVTEDL